MVAPVVSQTGLSADMDSLPSLETALEDIGGPGCGFYFRRATGRYVSRKYELEYSEEAKSGKVQAWVQQFKVFATVKRPTASGGEEVLPQQLAVWAACLLPGTEAGKLEAAGSVRAVLKELGIEIPDEMWASARPPRGGPWASLAKLALGWAAPKPLNAAQKESIFEGCTDEDDNSECNAYELPELIVTVAATCPLGFDLDVLTGGCGLNFLTLEKGSPITFGTLITIGGGAPGDNDDEGEEEEDNDDDDTEPPPSQLSLSCPSTTRGGSGGCSVRASDSDVLAGLSYAWTAGAGVVGPSGPGKSLSSWYGTATSTRSLTVAISGPEIANTTLTGTVTVQPRNWGFPAPGTQPAYGIPHTGSWENGEWGRFAANLGEFVADTGTGPWSGVEYVAWPEAITAQVYIHPDLNPQDPGSAWAYPTTDAASAILLRQHCAGHAGLPATATVYTTNHLCSTLTARSSFHDLVDTHEQAHVRKYNSCRDLRAIQDGLNRIEGILGEAANDGADDGNRVLAKVVSGTDAGVGPAEGTEDFWYYTDGQYRIWVLTTADVKGHTGMACR